MNLLNDLFPKCHICEKRVFCLRTADIEIYPCNIRHACRSCHRQHADRLKQELDDKRWEEAKQRQKDTLARYAQEAERLRHQARDQIQTLLAIYSKKRHDAGETPSRYDERAFVITAILSMPKKHVKLRTPYTFDSHADSANFTYNQFRTACLEELAPLQDEYRKLMNTVDPFAPLIND